MSGAVRILVVCEIGEDGKLSVTSRELLGLAQESVKPTSGELVGFLIGAPVAEAAREASRAGVHQIFIPQRPNGNNYASSEYLGALEEIVTRHPVDAIFGGHTAACQDLLPKLAFKRGSAIVTDCTAIEYDECSGNFLMTKPIYGGNALAVFECATRPQIATVRRGVGLLPEERSDTGGEIIPVKVDPLAFPREPRIVARAAEEADDVRLEEADIVVSGGRGIGGPEGFRALRDLADALGGALAASRPPCDMGWMPSTSQVGLTGKVVAPGLYVAVGISGAMQHMTGLFESKRIVAINKDGDARIFKMADYGVVGDYREVIPVLTARVKELKSGVGKTR